MSAMDVEDAAQGEGEGAEATSEVVEDLSVSDVVTKYKLAAEIVNKTLTGLVGYAKPGMRTVDLCVFGDQLLAQQCGQVFKSKKIDKGIAFPTCVSANDCVSHYSPVTSDPNIYVLKEGDLVKVDVGVHIDGYPAVAAHTFVLQGDTPGPVAGRAADVLQAAYLGAEAAVKLVSPESTNSDITAALQQVATDFGVTPAQGVLMHQMKRYVRAWREAAPLGLRLWGWGWGGIGWDFGGSEKSRESGSWTVGEPESWRERERGPLDFAP